MIADEATTEPQHPPLPVGLICYPHDDATFLDRVRMTVAEQSVGGRRALPDEVSDRLRGWYPRVAISVREPLADLWGSHAPTWYVYRDGRILPDRPVDATST